MPSSAAFFSTARLSHLRRDARVRPDSILRWRSDKNRPETPARGVAQCGREEPGRLGVRSCGRHRRRECHRPWCGLRVVLGQVEDVTALGTAEIVHEGFRATTREPRRAWRGTLRAMGMGHRCLRQQSRFFSHTSAANVSLVAIHRFAASTPSPKEITRCCGGLSAPPAWRTEDVASEPPRHFRNSGNGRNPRPRPRLVASRWRPVRMRQLGYGRMAMSGKNSLGVAERVFATPIIAKAKYGINQLLANLSASRQKCLLDTSSMRYTKAGGR